MTDCSGLTNSALFSFLGEPSDDNGDWEGRVFGPTRVDDETLAIRRCVIVVARFDRGQDAGLEKHTRRGRLERRLGSDLDRHDLAVRRDVEQLFAVPPPARLAAASRRDL